jgi:lipopolysaccharide export system protein LptC
LNAIFNLPRYLRILLPLVAILSIWLLLSDENEPVEAEKNDIHRSSDYAMTDFTMTIMDINGTPARVIKGKEMAHYPADDSTEIIDPIAEFLKPGKDSWVITSDHGHTQGDNKTILLTGNVIITNENNPAFKMLTDKLTLDTQYNTAYTDHAVTIKTPNGDTESVGLHADMNDETINLHSRVKGQYDAPPN